MADLQRDDRDEGRTATSTGAHVTHGEGASARPLDDRGASDRPASDRPMSMRDTSEPATGTGAGSHRLLGEDERSDLRERWDALQGRFVDDPAGSTHLADELLRDTRDRIERRWEERHRELTDRWEDRDDLTTEDLRTTLRRYRDAFEQLISTS